ncbi:MAG TPA: helix-turn-helix transcriptional regulator [Gemmatimonadaceae bacterium]|nr:helix-turn-helix transcriptional regulator [Gemmatimonadaceae bacterium]
MIGSTYERRDRLIDALEAAADSAFAVTPDSRIVGWNAGSKDLFAHSAPAVLGRRLADVLPSVDGVMVLDESYCRDAARRGGVQNFDLHVVTGTGSKRWVNVSVLVFDVLDAGPQWIVHLAHDITQRKRKEEVLADFAERAHGVMHRLNGVGPVASACALTAQELRILHALADGDTTALIARRFGISANTLRNHLYHINRKLGTHDRLQAVTFAMRHKLV